jgi:VIT1/CCC1 family predicted Fe2+/Mn2+ transporter
MGKETQQKKPEREKGWINTEDGISEVLYGLIMALTFTCTISVTKTGETTVHDMLFGAMSCNTAWGLIDAVMYLLMAKTDADRSLTIRKFIRKSTDKQEAYQFITDAMPADIANALKPEEIERIRQSVAQLPEKKVSRSQKWNDVKTAAGILLLVMLTTFPVAVPFIFISNMEKALRVSNIVAILLMFICGWMLGKYAGRNQFLSGITLSLFGVVMVIITIALGG